MVTYSPAVGPIVPLCCDWVTIGTSPARWWEELPPPESFYIESSSPEGGSKIRRIIGSDPSIQIPHIPKSVAVQWPNRENSRPQSRGVLNLVERGCAALMGRFFTRNPETWVSFFTKKSLNMGQLFWLSPNFQVFAWRKPWKSRNFWKMGLFFKKKP